MDKVDNELLVKCNLFGKPLESSEDLNSQMIHHQLFLLVLLMENNMGANQSQTQLKSCKDKNFASSLFALLMRSSVVVSIPLVLSNVHQ